MKKLLFSFFLIVFAIMASRGQELFLPSAILSSAGNNETTNDINISKWRLGEVHVVTFNSSDKGEIATRKLSVYPNPVRKNLHVDLKVDLEFECNIGISDITGKKILLRKTVSFLPGKILSIDVSEFISGIYLLKIIPINNENAQVVKFQKY